MSRRDRSDAGRLWVGTWSPSLLWVVWAAWTFPATSQTDARTLLRSVAENYRAMTEYHFEVQSFNHLEAPGLRTNAPEDRYILAVSHAGKVRYEARLSLPHTIVIVGDSQRIWTYHSPPNRYTEEAFEPNTQGGEAAGSAKRGWRIPPQESYKDLEKGVSMLFGRFRLLSSPDLRVENKGERVLKLRDQEVGCTILFLAPKPGSQQQWTDELWIDPSRLLVLKSVFTEVRSVAATTAASVRTLIWNVISAGEPVPASLFVFTPPRGAKRIEAFDRRNLWRR